jgi:hypothetical protein
MIELASPLEHDDFNNLEQKSRAKQESVRWTLHRQKTLEIEINMLTTIVYDLLMRIEKLEGKNVDQATHT